MGGDAKPVLLALGSNLGDRREKLNRALEELESVVEGLKYSLFYKNPPWEFESERDFLNCVAWGETALGPEELLEELHEIEDRLGRKRDRDTRDRVIDIDIILLGAEPVETDAVQIPHPEWRERSFVVIPILELAGEHDELCDWLRDAWEIQPDELETLGGELSAAHPLTPVLD